MANLSSFINIFLIFHSLIEILHLPIYFIMCYVFEIFCLPCYFLHFFLLLRNFLFEFWRQICKFGIFWDIFSVTALLFRGVFESNSSVFSLWVCEWHLNSEFGANYHVGGRMWPCVFKWSWSNCDRFLENFNTSLFILIILWHLTGSGSNTKYISSMLYLFLLSLFRFIWATRSIPLRLPSSNLRLLKHLSVDAHDTEFQFVIVWLRR